MNRQLAATLVALSLAGAAVAAPQQKSPDMQGTDGVRHAGEARGTGIVKAIDAPRGTMTLQHQAIASIGWPAMTMAFKVATPALLKSVRAGDTVHFRLHPDGMNSTITAIEVVPR